MCLALVLIDACVDWQDNLSVPTHSYAINVLRIRFKAEALRMCR